MFLQVLNWTWTNNDQPGYDSLTEMHRQLPIEMVILLPSHNCLPLIKHTKRMWKTWGNPRKMIYIHGSKKSHPPHTVRRSRCWRKRKRLRTRRRRRRRLQMSRQTWRKEIEDNQYPESITWYFTRGIISRLFSLAQLVLFQFDHIK